MKTLDELRRALHAMIDGTNTMRVPADEDNDEDLVLAAALREHAEMREILTAIVGMQDSGMLETPMLVVQTDKARNLIGLDSG